MSLAIDIRVKNLGGDLRAQMRRRREDTIAQVGAFLREELEQAQHRLEDATPVKTGRMRDSWIIRQYDAREGRLLNTAPYASYLFTGTRPHNIPGAFGYARPFGTSGRFSGMFHPGTKQDSRLVAAMHDESARIKSDYKELGGKVAATFWRKTLTGGDIP